MLTGGGQRLVPRTEEARRLANEALVAEVLYVDHHNRVRGIGGEVLDFVGAESP